MSTTKLENAILSAIGNRSRLTRLEWVPGNWTEWQDHIQKTGFTAENMTDSDFLGLITEGLILARKFPHPEAIPVEFVLAPSSDAAYRRKFFRDGSFQLCLTAKGRRALNEAELDDLVPLRRRKCLDHDADQVVKDALRNSKPLCCLMTDVDHFKRINELNGHGTGDEILIACAEVMKRRVGGNGKAYRYGGDEYAALLDLPVAESRQVAEAYRQEVEDSCLSRKNLRITVSVGVASVPDHAKSAKDLLEQADQALLKAKRSGGNLTQVAD